MSERTDPEYRLGAYRLGYHVPLVNLPELAALLIHPLEDVWWANDWRVGEAAPSDDDAVASTVYGRLLVESIQWMELGRRIGVFPPSENAYSWEAQFLGLDEVLPGGNPWPREADVSGWTVGSFNTALGAAMEDSNPDRLEFVRVVHIASPPERQSRLAELKAAERLITQLGDMQVPSPLVDGVSWALSGQESAVSSEQTPSFWRSYHAAWPTESFVEVAVGAGSLASAVLEQMIGRPLSRNFVLDLMYDGLSVRTLASLESPTQVTAADQRSTAEGYAATVWDQADSAHTGQQAEAPSGTIIGAEATAAKEKPKRQQKRDGLTS